MLNPERVSPNWPPDYFQAYARRQQMILGVRKDPKKLYWAYAFYKKNPAAFISDFADTYDPRLVFGGGSARMPFLLFPRQAAMVDFLQACLNAQANGLIEKARDMGATWLCSAFSVWLWLFVDGSATGWGSRKADLVDKLGDPDSIFEKMRMIVRGLPSEFLPRGFVEKDHMTYMRFVNPQNGSTITGESGDNIGRGGRKLIYFKDESAHYERPEAIEAALTDNTRVQIDLSSVFGTGTVFHRKREAGVDWAPGQPAVNGRTNIFVLDWRDHPGKSQQWYDERRQAAEDNGLLHLFAQEVDRDYSAALEGVIIPALWVKAAVDADVKLGFDDSGRWGAALDVADGGGDTNALAKRKGVILNSCDEWGARDTGETARRAVAACRDLGHIELQYDCIGVGAGVKAETNRLAKDGDLPRGIRLVPWNAGAAVLMPEGRVIPNDRQSPKNEDFYTNLKAQAWWCLRRRFELTYRAVRSIAEDATPDEKSFTWRADDLISLPSTLPNLRKIEKELSQATASQGSRLKLIVDKSPEGTKSPNLADAIVMCFWPMPSTAFVVNHSTLARAQGNPAPVVETPATPSSPNQPAVRISSNLLAQVRNRR